MDHFPVTSHSPKVIIFPVQHQPGVARAPDRGQLNAGQAVTLRAKQLSVLRISHGRVWVTLSHAGPYSRVPGGDHFLSRGESLTLLTGQELVIEPFEPSASSSMATAHFSWETPGVAASAPQQGMGVQQPLRDLSHALGLVADACSRLVQALAHGAATLPFTLLNASAIFLVARRARIACQGSPFDMQKSTL